MTKEREAYWKPCCQLAKGAYLRTNASAGMPIRCAASYCNQEQQRLAALLAVLCAFGLEELSARASPNYCNCIHPFCEWRETTGSTLHAAGSHHSGIRSQNTDAPEVRERWLRRGCPRHRRCSCIAVSHSASVPFRRPWCPNAESQGLLFCRGVGVSVLRSVWIPGCPASSQS